MKKFKNSFLNSLNNCWHEISISDKALIIIMIFLLIQSIYNLFIPESAGANSMSINLAVRASIASIFGYFLSENFLNNKVIKNNSSDIIVPINKTENTNDTRSNSINTNDIINSSKSNISNNSKDYICNKTIQILIALTVCIIALISLIIANNFKFVSSDISPTVIQFRDLIGNCIGFLLGHSSSSIKNNSSK